MTSHLATRALSRTIWAKGAIPPDERKYATPLKRFALPVYDAIAIIGGFYAVRSGVPSFELILPDQIADLLGYGLIIVATLCLAGISFPSLWRIETGAKIALFGMLGTYLICLRTVAGPSGTTTRDFVSVIVALAMILPLVRLWILGTEKRDRDAKAAAARKAAE